MALPDEVREQAAAVMAAPDHVRVVEEAIAAYGRALPAPPPPRPPVTDEGEVAFTLQLNAINFGSGWFPTLRKPAGVSGFRTVEAGLRAQGPYSSGDLRAMSAERIARDLGQEPGHELMGLFAA